jgi:hypothetical protein
MKHGSFFKTVLIKTYGKINETAFTVTSEIRLILGLISLPDPHSRQYSITNTNALITSKLITT